MFSSYTRCWLLTHGSMTYYKTDTPGMNCVKIPPANDADAEIDSVILRTMRTVK
jgi:hypothetical protein